MSRMLVLLNLLKSQANQGLLTNSQLATSQNVLQLLRFPGTLNLYGPAGSGKTFLAWVLSRSTTIGYYPSPAAFDDRAVRPVDSAIVDNAGATARHVRDLLAISQRKGTHTLLFITHQPNEFNLPKAMLGPPTPDDFDVIYRNLSLLEHYAVGPVRQGSLWDAVRSVI